MSDRVGFYIAFGLHKGYVKAGIHFYDGGIGAPGVRRLMISLLGIKPFIDIGSL